MKSLFLAFIFSVHAFAFDFKSSEKQTQFIELYSTQSCSSCPPAQRRVNKLRENSQVFKDFIPVVFHVDYWDYLGWKDPYSSKQHTNRQKRLVHSWKGDTIYTPMFVVNGSEHRGRFNLGHSNQKPGILETKLSGNNIKVDLSGIKTKVGRVHIAYLGHDITTAVKAGENSGKRLPQDFLVLDHKVYTAKNKVITVVKQSIKSKSKQLSFVVWLEDENGRYIQATGGYLN